MTKNKPKELHRIDKAWFEAKYVDLKLNATSFARQMGMDKGSWSRTLAGIRKMTDAEKVKAAKIIGVHLQELLPHVGLPIQRELPDLAGIMDADGEVTLERHAVTKPEVFVLIHGNPHYDGFGLVCLPASREHYKGKSYQMGLAELPDGRRLFRGIKPSPHVSGRFDLSPVFGFGFNEKNVELVGVIPVTAIRRVSKEA